MSVGDVSKRILLGRKLRSSQLGETLLPKRIALPVFASDALSSNGYATQEILLVLSLGGAWMRYTGGEETTETAEAPPAAYSAAIASTERRLRKFELM